MAGLNTLSELAGYASIACWLGAQFPQVLENIKRQSCEGLALPFLANWFLGDLSNLIGCILTHQLPFQTYLATYFVFVDLSLVAQYFYYLPKQPPLSLKRTNTRGTSVLRRRSTDGRSAPRLRTLSAVAANVAAAAAFAAQQEEYAHQRHPGDRHYRARSVSLVPDSSGSHASGSRPMAEDEEEDDTTIPTAMMESFRSEGGHDRPYRTRPSWHGGATASATRSSFHPSLQFTDSSVPFPESGNRGRSRQRSVDLEPLPEASPPSARRSSRASRRGAGMVFLGAWALFGIGTLAGSRRGVAPSSMTSIGKLLSFGDNIPSALVVDVPVSHPSTDPPSAVHVHLSSPPNHDDDKPPPTHHTENPLTSQRVLGRIFAWLCTTLYLTSRLPQIWKNFVRKSVEGLSMYLFVFAFLGNCFYVASIMTSPQVRQAPPIAEAFLKESLPYLLGSGGTLMFDITIVSQSFIYRPKHRRHHKIRTHDDEEAAGLLSADALANPYHAAHSHPPQQDPYNTTESPHTDDTLHTSHSHHTTDVYHPGSVDATVHARGRTPSASS
ncbi:hypothetical protein HGRIS_012820 [Hohenbuehelia grisea]|uniref:PQ-loop-domain-containing protein n=1 Tax=Hohenbuehelia grisea TaxID=104357 RepID=A0ABR3ITG2_9AGAR